jgi:hypothetical protein
MIAPFPPLGGHNDPFVARAILQNRVTMELNNERFADEMWFPPQFLCRPPRRSIMTMSQGAGYARLNAQDNGASLTSTYEEWQFERTRWLHHGIAGLVIIYCAISGLAQTSSDVRLASLGGVAVGAVMVALREAAHVLPSERQRASARRATTALVVVLLLAAELNDLATLVHNPQSLSVVDWLLYFGLPCPLPGCLYPFHVPYQ